MLLKKGEHGAMLFSEDGVFVAPAFPSDNVVDPTGAGDAFAGGVLGHLSESEAPLTQAGLRRAMAYGAVIGSLIVEGFGLDRLKGTDRREIDGRLEQYRKMLTF